MGGFSEGQEYPLLWKEGEVYLLPLSEEEVGFYKAPGESIVYLLQFFLILSFIFYFFPCLLKLW